MNSVQVIKQEEALQRPELLKVSLSFFFLSLFILYKKNNNTTLGA